MKEKNSSGLRSFQYETSYSPIEKKGKNFRAEGSLHNIMTRRGWIDFHVDLILVKFGLSQYLS